MWETAEVLGKAHGATILVLIRNREGQRAHLAAEGAVREPGS